MEGSFGLIIDELVIDIGCACVEDKIDGLISMLLDYLIIELISSLTWAVEYLQIKRVELQGLQDGELSRYCFIPSLQILIVVSCSPDTLGLLVIAFLFCLVQCFSFLQLDSWIDLENGLLWHLFSILMNIDFRVQVKLAYRRAICV